MTLSRKSVNQFFLVGLVFIVGLAPGLALAKVFDRVVAKVNSEIITLSSVEETAFVLKEKYRRGAAMGEVTIPEEKELMNEALEKIIGDKLKLQQGKKMGFVVDDAAVNSAFKNIEAKNGLQEGQLAQMLEAEGQSLDNYKNQIRDQILVSKITSFELGSRVNISERKIRRYYRDHQKEFWEDGKARVKHILILLEKGSPAKVKKEKYKRCKEILAEIKSGKDFAEAAREYSEDISASSGGDVGFVEKGRMVPEFEKAVYSLKEGEVSDIVETEYGFHIIKVEEVKEGRTIPLKEIKPVIRKVLASEKQKSAYDDWMQELKDAAYIEVSLFTKPKNNLSSKLFKSEKTNKNDFDSSTSKELKRKKSKRTAELAKKKKMQKIWEEMYKSVEKNKIEKSDQPSSPYGNMESQLEEIKKLRSQGKISEAEYQRRKQKLLDEL
ncbi:MAG: peptidylprolyl isomerase [Nitrospinota bacterium]